MDHDVGRARSPIRGRRSLRFTLTALASVIIALALTVASIALVVTLRSNLTLGVANTARLRAGDVAGLVQSRSLPSSLAFPGEESSMIQVIHPAGTVVASTRNIAGEDVVISAGDLTPAAYVSNDLPIAGGQRFLVTVARVDTPGGRFTIISAESLAGVDASVATLIAALALGCPLLVGLVAGLTWVVAKRTLGPVEALRAEVADITATGLDRRVSVPDARDEIARLAETMNEMLDRLEDSSQRQRRFVADASHQLRSPITSLRAQLEIGLAHPDRPDWPDRVTGALADADRIEALVRDLLSLARLDHAGPVPTERCDLAAITGAEVEWYRGTAAVEFHLAGGADASVSGNPTQLRQVVRNLLDNATRHARRSVTVTIECLPDAVRLDVSDDGPGIPVAARDRIFERFERLDDARAADDGGSGLGLAIVREIVLAHGGSVEVAGTGLGASFNVVLPRVTGSASRSVGDRQGRSAAGSAAVGGRSG